MVSTKNNRIEVRSTMDEFHQVEVFVENVCEKFSIFDSYFSNIMVSVGEAFENAVTHGNQNQPEKFVQVSYEHPVEGLIFKVKDQGEGYDPEAVRDPFEEIAKFAKKDTEELPGKGLYLMRSLSDEIKFEDDGRCVSMLYKINTVNRELTERRSKELLAYLNAEMVKRFQL